MSYTSCIIERDVPLLCPRCSGFLVTIAIGRDVLHDELMWGWRCGCCGGCRVDLGLEPLEVQGRVGVAPRQPNSPEDP